MNSTLWMRAFGELSASSPSRFYVGRRRNRQSGTNQGARKHKQIVHGAENLIIMTDFNILGVFCRARFRLLLSVKVQVTSNPKGGGKRWAKVFAVLVVTFVVDGFYLERKPPAAASGFSLLPPPTPTFPQTFLVFSYSFLLIFIVSTLFEHPRMTGHSSSIIFELLAGGTNITIISPIHSLFPSELKLGKIA